MVLAIAGEQTGRDWIGELDELIQQENYQRISELIEQFFVDLHKELVQEKFNLIPEGNEFNIPIRLQVFRSFFAILENIKADSEEDEERED